MNILKNTCVIIPARYKSSRFPGKPLKKIKGKEMILWVAELSAIAVGKEHVFIATDNIDIQNISEKNGFNTIMTNDASTGTDRIAEASKNLNYEIIINVQGDEPLLNPLDIKECIRLKKLFPEKIINGFAWFRDYEDPKSKNIPKVVTSQSNELIYISREPIPGCKDSNRKQINYRKQVCIYGFSKLDLEKFSAFGKSNLEEIEDIEILRFIDIGKKILMYECKSPSIAVDLPSDIERVENFLIKSSNDY